MKPSSVDRYDVVVIGGGPGGYNAAIRAGQLGLRAICVERASSIGGAALNTGCIPSRALLHASEVYATFRSGRYATLGVEGTTTLNLTRMMSYKSTVIDTIAGSIQDLLRRHHVAVLYGHASLAGSRNVLVSRTDGTKVRLTADHVVIATGSEPVPFSATTFDHRDILDSADALSLDRVPTHLVIIGGGATGIEIGSIWQRLGTRVTVVERGDHLCPWLDDEVAAALTRTLRRQGMDIRLSTEAVTLEKRSHGVRLQLRTVGEHSVTTLDAQTALVAVGRKPVLTDLALDSVGLKTSPQGLLAHKGLRTLVPGIWLIGDAKSGQMLARKAEEEAIACAEQIAGLPGFVDYFSMPMALFTVPEVAKIGRTEAELQAAGIPYRVGRIAFGANARARIRGQEEGFVKLLVDAQTNLVIGAHLIGPGAAELVSEVALAMDASTICEDLARIPCAHPTLSEALRQAAMAAGGWAIQG